MTPGPATTPYVAVVGAVNVDVCGRSLAPLVDRDSNPGTVTTSLGGVGRNIAHNLALLDVPVALVTALGGDDNAARVTRSCDALGIDLRHSLRVENGTTSTYLVLTDHQGEVALAVSDMGIYEKLTPAYMESQLDLLNAAGLVVLDTNIPADTVAFLATHCTAPLFADPVSTAKAGKLKPVLGRLHTLKANRLEASLLSGVEVTDEDSLRAAARALLDTGLKRVFLSLGPEGLLSCEGETMLRLPVFPGAMENATGCGDALTAALAWAFLRDLSLEESAKAGLAAAAIALASPATINPALSTDQVKKLAKL